MINWFPGHMSKTLREMQSLNKLCNCFVYVLDARSPKACLNPEFVKVIKDKPIVYVLNKSDKADERATTKWKQYFNSLPNSKCVVTNATISKSCQVITSAIMSLLAELVAENRQKQVNFVFRAMVLGVPNSGKSTIVNNLCGKVRAVTGDKAGVTKNVQWVNVNPTLQIMDTPGTLWPALRDEDLAYQLAYIGSVKDDVLNIVEVAGRLAVELSGCCLNNKSHPNNNSNPAQNIKPNITTQTTIEQDITHTLDVDKNDVNSIYGKSNLVANYKLNLGRAFDKTNTEDCLQLLELIARKRGCILRGNEIDYDRVAKLILNDYRKGSLGKITFTLPD